MPASPSTTPERIKDANLRYHDAAAAGYDSKWGIDFGPIGQEQVRAKLAKALGGWPESPFGEALEIGSGTGYFSLNLLQLGLIERLVATDISPGMLGELAATAERLGLEVETEATDAERLPFEDESFDLVFGHAVLHHLPDLPPRLAELRRVLRPGGTLAFCGEPSRYGDLLAAVPKHGAQLAGAALAARAREPPRDARTRPSTGTGTSSSPRWTCTPSPREARPDAARGRVRAGEDSRRGALANVFGWTARTLEGTADPERVPDRWRRFAFRSYLALQRLDASLLEPRLPASAFYNLVLSARKPALTRPRRTTRT